MAQKKKPVTTKPKKKKPLAVKIGQQHQEDLEAINKKLAQSQVELEAAYRQYTDLYDFAPVGYFTLARDGTVRKVNLAGANLLGVERAKLINNRLGLFVSDESSPTFNVFFEKLLSGEGKETCELTFQKNGNELFWARIEATCFEGGQECRAVMTDITERKRVASLLQARVRISEFAESHTFDELLQKTLDEAETLTGSQVGFTHFLEADQKTLQLQMWSTNTLANMLTAEGKDRHYSVGEAEVWADCVSTRAPIIHNNYPNLPASHPKGLQDEHALLRELIVPVVRNDLVVMIMGVGNKSNDYDDNDIETLSQLANLAWDIFQRKQAEELLKESEWRNRIVSELTTDYIFVVDVDPSRILKLRWASDNLFRLTGRTIEDVATSNLWGGIIHPDDRERFFGFINRILSTAEAGELECRTFHKHGGERWVWIFVRPQIGKGNSVTAIVGAIQDITQRKLAEQALETANRDLQTALALQQQLAYTDSLTGINNRRHLYELAEHEFETAMRYQQPLSVIMFDIDHFKQVNDTFGHTVGDQILQRVTQVACAELRSADVIGRYGGEEFVVILPMTNAKNAYPQAERIRMGVAAMRVPTEKGDAVVTLSIGIVEMTHDAQTESIEVMIRNADEAMYAAKQAGRNRTEIGN